MPKLPPKPIIPLPIARKRKQQGRVYDTIDLFNDLRKKHKPKVGGNFYDWLEAERKQQRQKPKPKTGGNNG